MYPLITNNVLYFGVKPLVSEKFTELLIIVIDDPKNLGTLLFDLDLVLNDACCYHKTIHFDFHLVKLTELCPIHWVKLPIDLIHFILLNDQLDLGNYVDYLCLSIELLDELPHYQL